MPGKFFSQYFSFTRKERAGILTICILILLFVLLPFLFPLFIKPPAIDHTAFKKEIEALRVKQQDSGRNFTRQKEEIDAGDYFSQNQTGYTAQARGELFYFDPNTLSAEGWKKLGVREKTISTIQNYISKGGHFYKPEDIGRIWGLHADEVQRLIPYVRIEKKKADEYAVPENTEFSRTRERTKPAVNAVDINTADSSDLIALPGIGSKLANRIIAFRDKLGGFYKIEQVAETYALPDSTFQKIKDKLLLGNATVRKLNINTATIDELKVHPYIRYNMANAIVQYRQQHGEFAAVDGLRKIMMITDEIYGRLEPYLTIK